VQKKFTKYDKYNDLWEETKENRTYKQQAKTWKFVTEMRVESKLTP
jgi:hypothetical protein